MMGAKMFTDSCPQATLHTPRLPSPQNREVWPSGLLRLCGIVRDHDGERRMRKKPKLDLETDAEDNGRPSGRWWRDSERQGEVRGVERVISRQEVDRLSLCVPVERDPPFFSTSARVRISWLLILSPSERCLFQMCNFEGGRGTMKDIRIISDLKELQLNMLFKANVKQL